MPYAVDFPILGGNGRQPPQLFRALHANLLRWVGAADPDLASAVHGRPVRKAFTISGLRDDKEGNWWWHVTFLQNDVWELLRTWALAPAADCGKQREKECTLMLKLGGRAYPVDWLGAWEATRTYDQMLDALQPLERIQMEFLSPTAFSAGALDLPLPEPSAVFHSWLSRWNDFCPAHRRISTTLLDVVRTNVAISEHQLRTMRHDLGHGRVHTGFVGQVTFTITRAQYLNLAHVFQLNTLADYAEFCGTGHKTTYGMGQTRRLRS